MKPRALTPPPDVIARLPDVREVRVAMLPWLANTAARMGGMVKYTNRAGNKVWGPGNSRIFLSGNIRPPHPPGSLAWVRETFHECPHCNRIAYKAGGWMVPGANWRADDDNRPLPPKCAAHGWRSPVTMPKWASRWTLYIEDVGVVQDGDWKWRHPVRPIRANVDEVLADPKRYGVE